MSTSGPTDMSTPGSLPISVIIPFYRGTHHLAALTASLTGQGANQVIVVVDGGEHCAEVAEAFSSVPNSIVLNTPIALGTSGARNHGARHADQPMITFLDQDDSWGENFLRDLYANADAGVTAYDSDLYEERNDGSFHSLGMTMLERQKWPSRKIGPSSSHQLVEGFPMVKLLIPRAIYEKVGGFRENIFAVEDFDLVWRIVADGHDIRVVPQPRGKYSVSSNSITGRIAGGNYGAAMRAQRSWLDIWMRIATTRSFSAVTRWRAVKNLSRVVVRIGKLSIKRVILGHA